MYEHIPKIKQLRQTLNDGFRGHIRTRESKEISGILIDDCKKVFVTGSAWQRAFRAFKVQVQSFKHLCRFDKSIIIWENEVRLCLLTFFTLRSHLSYVSEREWKIFGTNEVTHPRNAWMTEQPEDRAGGFVEHNHTELELECRDQHFLSQGDAQCRRQLQLPPRDFVVFDFVGVSRV